MTDKQVIKDFVDMMEDLEGCYNEGSSFLSCLKGIKGTAAFKALKAIISPVSEEKRYFGHVDKDGNYTFPHETKQEESKKQTLLEYVNNESTPPWKLKGFDLIKVISDYLEDQNKLGL